MASTKPKRMKRKSNATSEASTSAAPIAMNDLQWRPVAIPAMALATRKPSSTKANGKGKKQADASEEMEDADEWDPFADLDEGADDFMGLQEVSGVGVRFQGDEKTGRTAAFYRAKKLESPSVGATSLDQGAVKTKGKKDNSVDQRQRKEPEEPEVAAPRATDTAPTTKSSPDLKSSDQTARKKGKKEIREASNAMDGGLDGAEGDDSQEKAIPEGLFSSFAETLESEEATDAGFQAVEFDDALLPAWPQIVLSALHPLLKRALLRLKFTTPTPVQGEALPVAVGASTTSGPRDIVALAQTGSGKTLAYALPILQRLLETKTSIFTTDKEDTRPLQALIVLPTRELALQVYRVFEQLVTASLTPSTDDSTGGGPSMKPWVRVAPILGGMSEERQWRLLRGRKAQQNGGQRNAEIIIATVGRLWELCKSDDYLPSRLREAESLVLDEADRLLETGKFQELSSVLELLQSPIRQTMMFSATLDATLQVNLTKSRSKVAKMLKQARGGPDMLMAKLVERVGFRDPAGPQLIDLTQSAKVSENLKEGKVECIESEKDLYLYYLLLRYPGSFLVFLNSIDSVRRLQPLLTNLGIQSFSLHGEMDQRARLRALDGFKKSFGPSSTSGKTNGKQLKAGASSTSVLLATDVAARGLDIPLVSYVVHFHLPRAADTYIHRSGRTARAGQTGLSLILLSPGEKTRWSSLRRNMGRGEEADLKDLPVTHGILGRLKTRLRLAKELDEARHRSRKEKADDDWVTKLAEEAEIALDDDDGIDPDADYAVSGKKGKAARSAQQGAIRGLEQQLAHELAQDLVARGVKRKFITQGAGLGSSGALGSDLLRDLVSGHGHDTFLGLPKSQAISDLESSKTAKPSGSHKKAKVGQ